jgi:hypothetical protein
MTNVAAAFKASSLWSPACWRRFARRASVPLAVSLAALFGCAADPEPTAETACIYPPLNIADMERELAARGVAFSRVGDCLTFTAPHRVAEAAQLAAFGEAPPSGRATKPADPAAMIRQLANGGIDAKIMRYGGMDYVVWSAEDAERAEVLLGMSAERREVLKRMR